MRIVSLLPSATEIVYSLGLEGNLVGVSFECDYPVQARSEHAVVVGGLDTAGLTPAGIDAAVRARVASGEQLYTLDEQLLARLDPDLVISQELCQVCALPSGQVTAALASSGSRAEVLTLDPHSLSDVLESIRRIGTAAGAGDRAAAVVSGLRDRLDAVRDRVSGRVRPRVAVLEWVDPPFTAGHWVPELVSAAGGEPVAGTAGGRSVQTDWSQFAAADPQLVIVAPCGFGLADAAEQALAVLDRLPPVTVWAIDADGLVVRPGPRLVTGVEALASILHPEVFDRSPSDSVRRIR